MSNRAQLAMGLSVHTGWAACVVVGGDPRNPIVVAREHVEMLDDPRRFVFHRAAAAKSDPEREVGASRRDAFEAARHALSAILEKARPQGGRVRACAVVAREGEMPASLAAIVSAHPRIHTAEGLFYRDVLTEAAEACALDTLVVPPKELEARASRALDVAPSKLASMLTEAGRAVGPPWGKDEKLAALAAWTVMALVAGGRR